MGLPLVVFVLAGAKFIIILLLGNSMFEFFIADFILSFDSSTFIVPYIFNVFKY